MSFADYKYQGKPIKLWKVIRASELNLFRSIVSKPFQFIEFHIKASTISPDVKESSLMYWSQAEDFYKSSAALSIYSKPLTNYYCAMNAVKTLLTFKGIIYDLHHGITRSEPPDGATELEAEVLKISDIKIAGKFYHYLDDRHSSPKIYSLKDLLYNIPFSHRAFLQTYPSETDLFLPVEPPRFSIVDDQIYLTCKCTIENLTCIPSDPISTRISAEGSFTM